MVTVLFTDLQGFTAFASKLEPTALVAFLNIMYTQVCGCVVAALVDEEITCTLYVHCVVP